MPEHELPVWINLTGFGWIYPHPFGFGSPELG